MKGRGWTVTLLAICLVGRINAALRYSDVSAFERAHFGYEPSSAFRENVLGSVATGFSTLAPNQVEIVPYLLSLHHALPPCSGVLYEALFFVLAVPACFLLGRLLCKVNARCGLIVSVVAYLVLSTAVTAMLLGSVFLADWIA